jgi:Protein of unknown function (DUF3631)
VESVLPTWSDSPLPRCRGFGTAQAELRPLRRQERDAIGTKEILETLHKIEESPWAEFHGKPLNARGLATQLKKYEIRSTDVPVGDWHGKGYTRADLWAAWTRYLPTDCRVDADSFEPESRRGEEADKSSLGPPRYESATSVTAAPTNGQPLYAICTRCGRDMRILKPGQTAHPACDQTRRAQQLMQ